jgi:predicted TPR repeat methyltransferase
MVGEQTQKRMGQPVEPEPEETERELTLDEAVAIAVALQQSDRLSEADLLFRRILDQAPDHVAAMHYSGILAHQLGQDEEAIRRVRASLEREPGRADWHSNHGIVLQAANRFEEAIAAYERAIALDPAHTNAYSNMGVLLRATGKPVESEAAYRRALELNPKHLDAWTNLGILLNGLGRTEEAVACYCKVILLRPKHKEARRLLALAHCTLGEVDQAIAIFQDWLAEDPGDPVASHMLAACTGDRVPPRASDDYVSRTFDSFAASFESKLAQLHYRAPRLVTLMLEDAHPAAAKQLDILDAGCGTGLCGPLLAPYARHLTGVDLSAGMMKQAESKGVYDALVQAELAGFLEAHPNAFDVVISADTFCYFGALDAAVGAAARSLRPGGLLIFTVEHAADSTVADFRLEMHGRYSHARPYVERVLSAAGLAADIVESDLRTESGVPVGGLVVRASRPGQ